MLCQLAKNFPPFVADLLERDKGLGRRFREETVTDLLMASLAALQQFGISVQFPDEPTTGADMDWVFVAPRQVAGGKYFRLLLQAKRSQFAKTKKGGYWFYHHLDHDKGQQAQTLVAHAGTGPGSSSTLPLYLLYHPLSGLEPTLSPSVEGVNVVFASLVAPVVKGGCGRKDKKVERWRPHFLTLTDLLCWPLLPIHLSPDGGLSFEFVFQRAGLAVPATGAFHPESVVRRMRALQDRERTGPVHAERPRTIAAAEKIPDDIVRLLNGEVTPEDRRKLERPRVVFSTDATLAKIG